jgi:hypothetical protein
MTRATTNDASRNQPSIWSQYEILFLETARSWRLVEGLSFGAGLVIGSSIRGRKKKGLEKRDWGHSGFFFRKQSVAGVLSKGFLSGSAW